MGQMRQDGLGEFAGIARTMRGSPRQGEVNSVLKASLGGGVDMDRSCKER